MTAMPCSLSLNAARARLADRYSITARTSRTSSSFAWLGVHPNSAQISLIRPSYGLGP